MLHAVSITESYKDLHELQVEFTVVALASPDDDELAAQGSGEVDLGVAQLI